MTPMPTTQGRETAAGRDQGADRPLIFSAPMVRALLAGRKTQTRRVLKPPRGVDPGHWMPDAPGTLGAGIDGDRVRVLHWPNDGAEVAWGRLPCATGDRLWVRETWQTGSGYAGPQVAYRASGDAHDIDAWDGEDEGAGPSFNYDRLPGLKWHTWLPDLLSGVEGSWRSPIHMPRALSRLTLIVENVRVERLADISDEDAKAEGLACLSKDDGRTWKYGIADRDGWPGTDDDGWPWSDWNVDPRRAYARLWDSIHGKGAFEASPWVAAISFRVIPQNIDRLSDPLPTGADAGEGRL